MPLAKKILATLCTAVSLAIAPSVRADDIPEVVAAQARALESGGATVAASVGYPDVLHAYAACFLQGFLRPEDEYRTTSPLVRRAWADGQAYRHAHPDQLEAILHAYGYVRVEADGTWRRNWETSRFVPDDRGGKSWYVGALGSRSWRQLGWMGEPPDDASLDVHVHVAGWLSKPLAWHALPDDGNRFLMATTLLRVPSAMRARPDLCIGPLALGGAAPTPGFACP